MKKIRLKKQELLLFFTPLVVLMVIMLLQIQRQRYEPDELDKALQEYAGANAIDCGRATADSSNRISVDTCAITTYKSGKPFWVRYDDIDHDQHPQGIYRDANGHVGIVTAYREPKWFNNVRFGTRIIVGHGTCGTSAIASDADKANKRRKIFFGWFRCNDED
jgi:hypothetical protein